MSTLRRSTVLAVATLLSLMVLSACGAATQRGSTKSPVTGSTLLHVDAWSAPVVKGPPSAAAFCAVITAMYRHEARVPLATNTVKEQILRDYVRTVPEAVAVAPPDIAAAARTYLTSVAHILSALAAAGLDYKKIKPGTLTPLLLDPRIKAAGNQVLAYSRTECHYTIGGT